MFGSIFSRFRNKHIDVMFVFPNCPIGGSRPGQGASEARAAAAGTPTTARVPAPSGHGGGGLRGLNATALDRGWLMLDWFAWWPWQVTKRVDTAEGQWSGWNWRTEGDMMVNGAYFVPSGEGMEEIYEKASSTDPKSSALVDTLTQNAGVLGDPRYARAVPVISLALGALYFPC